MVAVNFRHITVVFGFTAAFISVLHMYESFGWWRKSEYLKVHFAESWNEMHHLLIMEVIFFSPYLSSVFNYFFYICMHSKINSLEGAILTQNLPNGLVWVAFKIIWVGLGKIF
ncbi:putative ubiquinol oxidase (non-electrogenic) [Helianthus annuus]|nr:putative ubiquinol oxidase (non-electrogenic) [Helianthus annuus]